jgi:hypothetical protein
MESITNNAEDLLVDSLSSKLPGSGQYVTDSHNEGSNRYSASSGTRVLKFRLNGEGWLDPSTVRMMFDVVSDEPGNEKALKPIGHCHAFFRRLRVSVRGQIIEDIQDYTRVHHMFNSLQGPQVRLNEECEGFGYTDDAEGLDNQYKLPGIGGGNGTISYATNQTVIFKPLCGIFQQTKYIPLRYCPIEFELELADNDEPIVSTFGAFFTAANTTKLYHIEQCQIKCDIVSLDNSLDNSYVNHLLGGNTLKLVYDTYISSIQSIVSSDSTNVNVSRSLTSLRSIFISLDKNLAEGRLTWYNKTWNNFYSPMAGNLATGNIPVRSSNEIKHLQVQIGSKLLPEYPIRSHAECFYNLRKALGIQANSLHAIDIHGQTYRSNRFICGIDCEKMLGLAFTGQNTKNALMTVKLQTGSGDLLANRMHIVLVSQQIIDISDSGITIVD